MILPSAQSGGVLLPAFSDKLTRALLMRLPRGMAIVSNVWPAGQPSFCETVRPREERVDQWLRIKFAHADGRACHVFDSMKSATQWVEARQS